MTRACHKQLRNYLCALVVCWTSYASAQLDDSARPSDWNGLSDFVALAERLGTSLRQPTTVKPEDWRDGDAVLMIAAPTPWPVGALQELLDHGGIVCLADDIGGDRRFLDHYHFTLLPPKNAPAIAAAIPGVQHPLTKGLRTIWTNRSASLRHESLPPLLSLRDSRSALLMAGSNGRGTLIVLADPSVFIRQMLPTGDNRLLATNLLRFLAEPPPGRTRPRRIWLITSQSRWLTAAATGSTSPAARWDAMLGARRDVSIAPGWQRLGALLLACASAILVVVIMPWQSAYSLPLSDYRRLRRLRRRLRRVRS